MVLERDESWSGRLEIDYTCDSDDPDYIVCGFCRDIGLKWYDEDFIGIIPRLAREVGIEGILNNSSIDQSDIGLVKAGCARLQILRANALFWYSDGGISVSQPYKTYYKDLKYIDCSKGIDW